MHIYIRDSLSRIAIAMLKLYLVLILKVTLLEFTTYHSDHNAHV